MNWLDRINFESLSASLSRLPAVIQSIPDYIRNPAANPVQAAIVLGIIIVFVLIVLLSVILAFVRPDPELMGPAPRPRTPGTPAGTGAAATSASPGTPGPPAAPLRTRVTAGQRALGSLTTTAVLLVAILVLWGVVGVSTSSPFVCSGCHGSTSHSTAPVSDPHKDVQCVDCHEPGGWVNTTFINLPTRVMHIVWGQADSVNARGYGTTISSVGCRNCHQSQLIGVATEADRGLKVSHKEPLAAGAECVDCHTLTNGEITTKTVGMEECLRCHDNKVASAECKTCHEGDPARAIVATYQKQDLASIQVPTPDCSVCHFDMTRCNNCHGISMPHSAAFMAGGHAYEGAVNIWDHGGKICGKCHYAGHRDCVQEGCHSYVFPQHALTWKHDHQQARWGYADNLCGCHQWYARQHQGQNFCQVCHPTPPPGTNP